MKNLTNYQCKSIEEYFELTKSHPQLFKPRKRRKLILDQAKLEQFCLKNDQDLGIIAQTAFHIFVNDLVSLDGRPPHAYTRVIGKKSLDGAEGVVVIPVIDDEELGTKGDIIMLEQERHSFGEFMIELPRGFAEPGKSPEEQALEELKTETGYYGEALIVGRSRTDSGLTNSVTNFVLVLVNEKRTANPEATELIERVFATGRNYVWDDIQNGVIKDGFTIQGLALYERYLLSQ